MERVRCGEYKKQERKWKERVEYIQGEQRERAELNRD